MICIYALSAVISKPLKVFMPSTGPLDDRSNAYSRSVVGRGVSQRCVPPIVIMWTSVTPLSIKDDFINFTPNHFVILQKIKPVQCFTLQNDSDDDFVTNHSDFVLSFKPETPTHRHLNDLCNEDLPILKAKRKKGKQYPGRLLEKHAINFATKTNKMSRFSDMHRDKSFIDNNIDSHSKSDKYGDENFKELKSFSKQDGTAINTKLYNTMHEQIIFQDKYIAEMGTCNIPVTIDNCDNLTNTMPISPKPSSTFIYQSTAHISPNSFISTNHFEDKIPTISQASPSGKPRPITHLDDKSLPTSLPSHCSVSSDKSNAKILQNSSLPTSSPSHCSVSSDKSNPDILQNSSFSTPTSSYTSADVNNKTISSSQKLSPIKSFDHGNQPTSPTSSSGTNLPFNEFLSLSIVIKILLDDNNASFKEIPCGKKENVYFVIDNSNNFSRTLHGKKNTFTDDCGSWSNNNTISCLYMLNPGGMGREIRFSNGMYCIKKTASNSYKIIDPQPQQDQILTIGRYYSKLKLNENYKRKITWIKKFSQSYQKFAVVEYIGNYPGLSKHGNSKIIDNVYVRTPKSVLESIDEKIPFASARNLYDSLQNNSKNVLQKPRNLQQLYSRHHLQKQTKLDDQSKGYMKNYADEILEVINMAQNHEFVQKVWHGKDVPIHVILHTKYQVYDIKRFCCSGSTVLGIDKTYNLGRIFATVLVYKNCSVINQKMEDFPLFLGPILLHSKSDYETYANFFNHISMCLGNHKKLVFGTDDEKALHKAATSAFPNARHVLCTKHLKENLTDYLKDQVGADKNIRQKVVQRVFSLLQAKNEVEFDSMSEKLIQDYNNDLPKLVTYLNQRFLPLLKEKVWKVIPYVSNDWTNNNCESVNHILKCKTSWQLKKLPDLICIIYDLVSSHYKDVQKAFVSLGPYSLTSSFKQFGCTLNKYTSMSEYEQAQYMNTFMQYIPPASASLPESCTVSTNAKFITRTPSKLAGKKKAQRQRSRAVRSTTVQKSG